MFYNIFFLHRLPLMTKLLYPVTLFWKRHSQLSNWWHAPTRSLSLVDTFLACLLLADTVVCCQSVSQLSHQPRPVHCTCLVAFCSWEQQAQICPHISYRKLKVWWVSRDSGDSWTVQDCRKEPWEKTWMWDPFAKAFHKEIIRQQSVATKLLHSVRITLEQNPEFNT